MRIITGKAKGARIEAPEGDATRPTSERIKEAIFSSINFDIEGRRVLDLFAGCGQMGLEAMSRGAESATFVDSSAEAIGYVKANAKRAGFFTDCRYLVSDYRNYIRKASGRDTYNLVFIDPPYSAGMCEDAVKKLLGASLADDGCIFVIESEGDADILGSVTALGSFDILKSTRYGKKTQVNILLYRGGETS